MSKCIRIASHKYSAPLWKQSFEVILCCWLLRFTCDVDGCSSLLHVESFALLATCVTMVNG